MRSIILFTLISFVIFSCKKEETPTENGPIINIISPTSEDMPATGSSVAINANITDENEIHDVRIQITSDYSDGPASIEMFFDHIHNSAFNVDTSFIADIPAGDMANYTVKISAENMSGNASSKSVTFHVMDL